MAWRQRARATVQPLLGAGILIWETTQHEADRPTLLIVGLYLLAGRPVLGLLDRFLGVEAPPGPPEPGPGGGPPASP